MRVFSNKFILAFALVFASLQVQAQDNRLSLAKKLVALVNYSTMYRESVKQCMSPESYKADALASFQADPLTFGGVSPQSKYWPEAEAIFAKYRATMCEYLSPDEFSDFMANQYARKMSEDELQTAINFLSSAAGKKYQQASLEGSNALQSFAQKRMRELQTKAYKIVAQDLAEIGDKYTKEPR